LGEIASISKGQQLSKSNMIEDGKFYVLNGGMTPSGYTNNYNTNENVISISEGGNSCGYINFNREKFWSGGHNYTLENLSIDANYAYAFLKKEEKFIMSLRVGSGLPNIQKSRLFDVKIDYPSNNEQLQIGNYFQQIDNLITLHQRKCERK